MGNNKPKLIEDLGVLYPTKKSNQKARCGLYKCPYCNKEFKARKADVEALKTKSCGCLKINNRKKHELYQHILYQTWGSMKSRCYNIKHKHYKYYGGKGIKVCDRWLDINNFIEDMYPTYQEGLTLDRVEGDKDYEPDNCRWVSPNIQQRNTRDIYSNNTSGYRGVCWHKRDQRWVAHIRINNKSKHLGYYQTALEAAKAYETYVRVNNLEHNFTPVLTEEEINNLDIKEK